LPEIPSIGDLLKTSWYKFVAAISFVVFFLTLVINLNDTLGLENKYVFVFSLGWLLFSVTEWSEHLGIYRPMGLGLVGPFDYKKTSSIHWILKIIAVILILAPIIEITTGRKIIQF